MPPETRHFADDCNTLPSIPLAPFCSPSTGGRQHATNTEAYQMGVSYLKRYRRIGSFGMADFQGDVDFGSRELAGARKE